MESFKPLVKWLLSLIFGVFCLILLVPYTSYRWMYSVPVANASPAGPLVDGRVIEQTLVIPEGKEATCVGIYFATYARSNSSHLVATLQDGPEKESWRLSGAYLHDNSYHYFCPSWPQRIRSSLRFSIHGTDGTPANSPTLWLTSDQSVGVAKIDGVATGKGVAFALAERVRVSVVSLAQIAHGAFDVGWIATLLMGLAGIMAATGRKSGKG